MKNTFTKAERLCSQATVDWLFDGQGTSFSVYPFRYIYKTRPIDDKEIACPLPQLLISVPKKKLHHAVDRNRMKRLVREAYRTHKQPLVDAVAKQRLSLYLAVVYLSNEISDYVAVEHRITAALERMEKAVGNENRP